MYYFDESGDPGDPIKSATQKFAIVVTFFDKPENLDQTYKKLRKCLNVSEKREILKWQKLDKERKKLFESFYKKNINFKFYYKITDKKRSGIFGEELYKLTIREIIIANNLQGKFRYVGKHLNNMLDDLKREFKIFGRKIVFENCKNGEDVGVQICDLIAGYLLSVSEN